ncbi:MAG: DNA polymerase, partial [Patescibacteria group bacterium]|nr:DNA polymerase [Patescibacteria group bacterium]
ATSSGEPTGALYGLSAMLLKIIGELKPDFMVACFDLPGPTHRHEVYDAYKSGRAKIDNNLILQLERAKDVFTAFGIPIYSHPGFEADDIIGTIVHELKNEDTEIIVASGDMDTLQLVDGKRVQVYTLKKGINDTILYDEKKVIERFGFPPKLLVDYKGLRGDPSDNIIGVKGIGEKTATSLITMFGTVEDIYKTLKKPARPDGRSGGKDDTYKKAGLRHAEAGSVLAKAGINERVKNLLIENEEEALFSKTLATIRTDAPIHFTLPPEWRQNLELDKLLGLFSKLEFRTMGERAKRLVEKPDIARKTMEVFSAKNLPDSRAVALRDGFSSQYQVSLREEKELCLALWVIDSNLTDPTLEEIFRFTKTDSIEEAKKIIESELDKRKVRKVFEEIEKPIIRVVEEMNERGVKVDGKILKNLSSKYHEELTRLEKAIWKEAGEEFNINSPKVLSLILFNKLQLAEKHQKKTPTGALSTKESELEKLRDKHPIIALILEYRELAKLLSTYIDAIPPLLDKNSRLHSTFLQAGTTTGRMASNNPNLQNIPNKTLLGRAIRHAFVAEEGFKLVSLDYSQIELRIAAILSQDKKLIEIFKNGEDVHAGVAMRVFKVSKESVDKSMRTRAKTINFGILYGMGVNALKANLGVERKEAQEFYSKYFKTFAGLAAYLDKIKAEAKRKGYTETLFGRRRYFAGLNSPLPYVRAQAERMAINAPMQGTQADLIKIAMKRIDEHIRSEKHEDDMRLILQVHDELVYEAKDSLVNEAVNHFKQLMETILPEKKTFGVPIIAEAEVGKNWGEMHPATSFDEAQDKSLGVKQI